MFFPPPFDDTSTKLTEQSVLASLTSLRPRHARQVNITSWQVVGSRISQDGKIMWEPHIIFPPLTRLDTGQLDHRERLCEILARSNHLWMLTSMSQAAHIPYLELEDGAITDMLSSHTWLASGTHTMAKINVDKRGLNPNLQFERSWQVAGAGFKVESDYYAPSIFVDSSHVRVRNFVKHDQTAYVQQLTVDLATRRSLRSKISLPTEGQAFHADYKLQHILLGEGPLHYAGMYEYSLAKKTKTTIQIANGSTLPFYFRDYLLANVINQNDITHWPDRLLIYSADRKKQTQLPKINIIARSSNERFALVQYSNPQEYWLVDFGRFR